MYYLQMWQYFKESRAGLHPPHQLMTQSSATRDLHYFATRNIQLCSAGEPGRSQFSACTFIGYIKPVMLSLLPKASHTLIMSPQHFCQLKNNPFITGPSWCSWCYGYISFSNNTLTDVINTNIAIVIIPHEFVFSGWIHLHRCIPLEPITVAIVNAFTHLYCIT